MAGARDPVADVPKATKVVVSPPASAKVTVPALPVILVWSPVLVPEDVPEKLEALKAPAIVRAPPEVILLDEEKNSMSPVELGARVILPDPLASMVRASLVPVEMTERATPAAAAALLILMPVTEEAVEVSTWRA